MKTLSDIVRSRYTTKAFDPTRRISPEDIEELKTVLRLSPSSVNSQPWHFVIADTDEGKARIAQATQGSYAFNAPKVTRASHVVVLCSRTDLDPAYLQAILAKEDADGRFVNAQAREGQHAGRNGFAAAHRFDRKDVPHWLEKQVYIALGTLLLGASALGIDACPMEGFDARVLDEVLGLRARGLTPLVIVGLGYRSTEDFNASLPKSRLPAEEVFTLL